MINKLNGSALIVLLAFMFFLFTAFPCRAQTNENDNKLISYKLISSYNPGQIDKMAKKVISKDHHESLSPAKNGVSAYLVMYETVNYNGKVIPVSGLILIPNLKGQRLPLLSYQHGTIVKRENCPSYINNCSEAQEMLVIFASQGYIVSMPDYIGQGRSQLQHPYVHAQTEASTSLDMIKATQQLTTKLGYELNDKLFLMGYSQGGHSTAALQRLIEEKYPSGSTITASAPMSGPYNLEMCWESWVNDPALASAAVMARMIVAYNMIYGVCESLDEIFYPPYDSTVETIFDGDYDGKAAIESLPNQPDKMLKEDFLIKVKNGDHPFAMALMKNDLYDWAPASPTRLYHGSKDKTVPSSVAEFTYDQMKKREGNAVLVDIGEYNHIEANVPAYFMAKKWFDSL